MSWTHGYFAGQGYTHGYYVESMPAYLRFAAQLRGHQLPAGRFRYLDAGCGQGFNLILAAAAHPDSEFVGIDFMPEHVAHARNLAKRAGIRNVEFIEGDFLELAEAPEKLGQFDYVVAHGIAAWVSASVRAALYRLVGRTLTPGGVMYSSYNAMPGWLPTMPFQHWVLLEQESNPAADPLEAARAVMGALQDGAPSMFEALPGLPGRLDSLKNKEPSYLYQEYANGSWSPQFVSTVLGAVGSEKLEYLVSATLSDNFLAVLPEQIRKLVAAQKDVRKREQLFDFAVNQTFRRDVYVKGRALAWPLEQSVLLSRQKFIVNPRSSRPEKGAPYVVKSPSVEVAGDPALYGRVYDFVAARKEAATLAEIAAALAREHDFSVLLPAICLLVQGGWLYLFRDEAQCDLAKRLNLAVLESVFSGAPYRHLAAPAIGGGVSCEEVELMALALKLQGIIASEWPARIETQLHALGRTLQWNGKQLTTPQEKKVFFDSLEMHVTQLTLPLLSRAGGLG